MGRYDSFGFYSKSKGKSSTVPQKATSKSKMILSWGMIWHLYDLKATLDTYYVNIYE